MPPADPPDPPVGTNEWFELLPLEEQQKLIKESRELNEKINTLIDFSTGNNLLRQMLLLKAVESFMQDVHGSISCSIGEPFFHCVILIAQTLLRSFDQTKASTALHELDVKQSKQH